MNISQTRYENFNTWLKKGNTFLQVSTLVCNPHSAIVNLAPHFHPDPAGSFSCHYANNQNNVKMMTDVINNTSFNTAQAFFNVDKLSKVLDNRKDYATMT